jgi:hypothetical protein
MEKSKIERGGVWWHGALNTLLLQPPARKMKTCTLEIQYDSKLISLLSVRLVDF